MSKISKFISTLLISMLPCSIITGQQTTTNTTATEKSILSEDSLVQKKGKKKIGDILTGTAVSVDLCGLAMKGIGARFANMEVSARLGFVEKYFPIFELGLGDCTREGEENNNRFETTAPYFRVGMDYNFNKKQNGNRFFGGVRYGFSAFEYDFQNPDFKDEVWGDFTPIDIQNVKTKSHWAEIVVGVETKLWSIVRLGYNVRYRIRISQKGHNLGEPWYVPGYGRNGSSAWGGTLNLTFDVGKTARKQKKELINTKR